MRYKCLLIFLVLFVVLAKAQTNYHEEWQLVLLTLEDGDTLQLPAGTYTLSESLLLDGVDDVVIRGQGREKTILTFANQTSGAEGLKISNCDRILLEEFSIFDTAGDAIKAQACEGISFINVETSWTGKPDKTNGSYGLYPVQCSNVLIDKCKAVGASDAGIYVGQSDGVIVKNCHASRNVAGIEIENTTNAEIFDNLADGNTGGILVFDLPGLIKKSGGHVRVFRNRVLNNNFKNFAPAGNIVAQVPPGSGIMVLATSDVDIFENEILDHKTASVAVVSYYLTELPIQDEQYDPIPQRVRVFNNNVSRDKQWPALSNKVGKLLALKFGRKVPPLIYDGITSATLNGKSEDEWGVCVANNGVDFATLDAARGFKALERNPKGYACNNISESAASTFVEPSSVGDPKTANQ